MQALKEVIDMCAAEQGRREALLLPLSLVRLMGSAEGGLFLAQLLAWTERDGAWVLRSYADWTAATALPAGRVRAAARRGAALGILEAVAAPAGTGGGRCYRVLMAPLLRLLVSTLRDELGDGAGASAARLARRKAARRRVRLPADGDGVAGAERRVEAHRRVENPTYGEEAAVDGPAGAERPVEAHRRVENPTYGEVAAVGAERRVENPADGEVAAVGASRRVENPADGEAAANGANRRVENPTYGRGFDARGWQQALGELERKVPADVFARWLAGSRFAAIEGGTVVVAVGDMNTAWWLNTRLSRAVERAVNLVAPGKEWLAVEARKQ